MYKNENQENRDNLLQRHSNIKLELQKLRETEYFEILNSIPKNWGYIFIESQPLTIQLLQKDDKRLFAYINDIKFSSDKKCELFFKCINFYLENNRYDKRFGLFHRTPTRIYTGNLALWRKIQSTINLEQIWNNVSSLFIGPCLSGAYKIFISQDNKLPFPDVEWLGIYEYGSLFYYVSL